MQKNTIVHTEHRRDKVVTVCGLKKAAGAGRVVVRLVRLVIMVGKKKNQDRTMTEINMRHNLLVKVPVKVHCLLLAMGWE